MRTKLYVIWINAKILFRDLRDVIKRVWREGK